MRDQDWRTLAEPTYGIDGNSQAVRLDAGAEIQVINEPRSDGTVEVVARPAGGADDWDAYNDVLVTASALRFEEGS